MFGRDGLSGRVLEGVFVGVLAGLHFGFARGVSRYGRSTVLVGLCIRRNKDDELDILWSSCVWQSMRYLFLR